MSAVYDIGRRQLSRLCEQSRLVSVRAANKICAAPVIGLLLSFEKLSREILFYKSRNHIFIFKAPKKKCLFPYIYTKATT